ncbi:probable serine/threonine-protein kinase PBL1 [Papaver somniferum]|uniref:probable serine/threonine-protein kinase PBL1 n=1 Tax=Papaver somniferum TaxID=3469 RepID=UPI000E6FAABB|nr:probable serine/threonine-protein kinase PBL1 [Papaver somniferum]
MGCFTVLKRGKKKKSKRPEVSIKQESTSTPSSSVLPEPHNVSGRRSLQSAPSSFKSRGGVVQQQPVGNLITGRSRTLSAPSSLNEAAERDTMFYSADFDERGDDSGSFRYLSREYRSPSPQPLPLPSPQSVLKNLGSFKQPADFSGPLPLPPSGGGLKNFSYEELSSACQQFSADRCMSEGLSAVMYKASFGDDSTSSKRMEATVTRLLPSTQGLKEFISEVNTISSLQHPQLCKLIGFHAREGSDQRMLVYERLFHGSLDLLLYGKSDGPPIDWCTRMKVALCAAQGLAFLHEEGPFQAMYTEFSTANIQVDKDFSAKLSGYGCVTRNPEAEISNTSPAVANLPEETLERGVLTPKSNVWSFGLVLLELLTGRKNLDCRHPKEERNLVKWSRPFLADDCRLSLVMDPRLKGRFPPKAARTVADIALKCLQKEPSERPTMRTILESLKNIQDMKYSCRFPLQEPAKIAGKYMSRSPSLNGIVHPAPRLNFSPSPPSRTRLPVSPSGQPFVPLLLPSRPSTSTSTLDGNEIRETVTRKSTSSRFLLKDGLVGY